VIGADTIERFRLGDADAVRAVYNEYGRLVFTVARRVLGDRSLAEEAAQQAFVQAWRAASSFDAGRELGPWLATIARRVAIDVHRREARRAHDSLDAPGQAPLVTLPPSAEQVYEVWQVREAIDTLEPADRDLVRMQHLEGLTHSEIAQRLSVPIGTVKSRSFRVHRALAARLGHLRDPPGPGP
jgi:RNA polymerase sigma factor (sigma-70 family)